MGTEWRSPFYYLQVVLEFPFSADVGKSTFAQDTVTRVIDQIERYSRYDLIFSYAASLERLEELREIFSPEDFAERHEMLESLLMMTYSIVCVRRGKLLFGVRKLPFWCPTPAHVALTGSSELKDVLAGWHYLYSMARAFAPYFGSEGLAGQHERLLIPAPDRWMRTNDWTREGGLDQHNHNLARSLGFVGGIVPPSALDAELAQTALDRRYELVDDRAVLVKLAGNPVVDQVMLMQRDGLYIVAKVCIFGDFDMLTVVNLAGESYESEGAEESRNVALDYLVLSLYHDLVSVEEVEGKHYARKPRTAPRIRRESEEGPDLNTTTWQYIPRRQYMPGKNDSAVDRRRLTEEEERRQAQWRRYHAVVGHVRRLPEGWHPSEEKAEEAKALGIDLRDGETWIRPHERGLGDDLEGVDIKSIPHYLKKKYE